MRYYKDANGAVFAYETEADYIEYAPHNLVLMSQFEVDAHLQKLPTVIGLIVQIDQAADRARLKVAGDPLRAVEYERAAKEAADFANAGYEGAVPPMVAAWVTPNRTAQQAADDIINEANAYNAALTQLRTARLQAKEQIRALMAADQVEQAQLLASQTIAAIEAAVAGIGNNA